MIVVYEQVYVNVTCMFLGKATHAILQERDMCRIRASLNHF
jgi:hypothetical protein